MGMEIGIAWDIRETIWMVVDVPFVSSNHMRLILVLIFAMSRMMLRMMFERMSLGILDAVMVGLVVCWDMGWVGFINGYSVLLQDLGISASSHHRTGRQRRIGALR